VLKKRSDPGGVLAIVGCFLDTLQIPRREKTLGWLDKPPQGVGEATKGGKVLVRGCCEPAHKEGWSGKGQGHVKVNVC